MSENRWIIQLNFYFDRQGYRSDAGAHHWEKENTLLLHEWETDDEDIYDGWPE